MQCTVAVFTQRAEGATRGSSMACHFSRECFPTHPDSIQILLAGSLISPQTDGVID